MPEGLCKGTPGSLDCDDTCLDAHVDALGHDDQLVRVKHFHRELVSRDPQTEKDVESKTE